MTDRQKRWLIPTAAVFVGVCTALLWGWKCLLEQGLDLDEFQVQGGEPVHVLRIKRGSEPKPSINALILHGFQCNKSMMIQLGKSLALNGVQSYLIDLPGHGASDVPFGGRESTYESVWAVVDQVTRHEGLDPSSVALVGHSFGAMVAANLGLREERFRSHILLGPAYEPGLGLKAPQNLLLLVGEYDHRFVDLGARQMLIRATGGAVNGPGVFFGSFEAGNARLLKIIPEVGHMGLIYSPSVASAVQQWIVSSFPGNSRTLELRENPYKATAGLAVCWILLPVVLLAWAGPRLTRWGNASSPYLSVTPFQDSMVLTASLLAAWLLTYNEIVLRFLSLEEGEVIASLFFLSGLFAWTGFIVLKRRLVFSFTGREILVALIGAGAGLAFLGFCSALLTRELFHLELHPTRIWRFVVLFLLLLPFFLGTEGVFRGLQGRRRGSWIWALGSLAMGVGYFALQSTALWAIGNRLGRFGPALTGLAFYLQTIQVVLFAYLPSTIITAVFSSLAMSWIISVAFLLRA